ncbi:MAG: hypothetical protein V4622_00905 [Bacteroidota bacterium]
MFARFFLLTLSIISLVWIVFIGYDLLDQKDNVSPQAIFSQKDGEILIINRSSEVLLEELTCKINPEITALFSQLLKNVFPNERIYISEKRPILIVESPNIWTKKGVQDYFETKGIKIAQPNEKQFTILGNLKCSYKKNHLLISKTANIQAQSNPKEWPLWDNKASASIIHLSNPLKSTNVYFKENGTVSYQTKYGPELDCKKVDDEDLFSQFIPSEVENYHFIEKEFALKTKYIMEKSPLYEWMDEGMIEFDYQNTSCLLSDYNKVIDPMSLLGSDSQANREENLSSKFTGIQLTKNFPQNISKGFYIGKVADKVILSEKKEVLEKIIADYQLGNTLALNPDKARSIFYKMPKKVSERNTILGKTFSVSSYKNLLIKTQLFSETSTGSVSDNEEEKTETKNNSFSYSGEIVSFLGNGSLIYSFSNQNEIIVISNKKQLWKQKLEGQLIGTPKLIDVNENGSLQLLVNTSEKVYLFNDQGSRVNEFPLNIKCANAVSFYRWNNKANFLVVNSANELLQIDQNGRILKKLKLNLSNVKNEIDVYKNGRTLTALVTGDQATQLINLDRNKNTKTSVMLPKERLQMKTTNGFYYFEHTKQALVRFDQNGNKSNVHSSSSIKNLKKIYKGKQTLICFQDKNTIFVLNENGNISQKFVTSVNEIENFDVLTSSNGNTYVAVIDEIENNVHLFDSKGTKLNEKALEGKSKVKLSDENGKLTITTLIENYIVQYYDVLAKTKD